MWIRIWICNTGFPSFLSLIFPVFCQTIICPVVTGTVPVPYYPFLRKIIIEPFSEPAFRDEFSKCECAERGSPPHCLLNFFQSLLFTMNFLKVSMLRETVSESQSRTACFVCGAVVGSTLKQLQRHVLQAHASQHFCLFCVEQKSWSDEFASQAGGQTL